MRHPKRTLNIGDVVYEVYGSLIYRRLRVTNASDTVAYLEYGPYNVMLRRQYSPRPNVPLKQLLKPSNGTAQYFAETPDLNARYQRSELEQLAKVAFNRNIGRLSADQLKLVLTILNDTQ